MKMVAPAHVANFTFDNVTYEREADGTFDIKHPDHIKAAKRHGARGYDPNNPDPFSAPADEPVSAIPDEHGNLDQLKAAAEKARAEAKADAAADLKAKDDRIAELEAALAAKDAEVAHDLDDGASAAQQAADATDDTSREAGGGTDQQQQDETVDTEAAARAEQMQKIGEELAKNPDFEAMDRDAKVDWLAKVGVTVSPAISKVKAQEAIDETVADYKADLEKAKSE